MMTLNALPKESLSDQAYEIVEEMIVTLQLPPGAILTEAALSESIGIGRTPLREALKRLEMGRLIRSIPRRGIMAAELNIANQFLILETRRELDRLIAVRAARRASAEQRQIFAVHAKAIVETARAERLTDYLHADYEFDELLTVCGRNPFAAEAVQPLHVHSRRFWYAHREQSDWVGLAELHAALIGKVIDADEAATARASDQLIDHLQNFTRAVMEAL
jgi:DNA-binding GntR family transcriptional regulator